MKTVHQIRNEIDNLLDSYDYSVKKNHSQLKENFLALKQCLYYLETKPDPLFVVKEYNRIKNEINILTSRYQLWLKNVVKAELKGVSNKEKYYEKLVGIPQLRKQLEMLEYLLSD